MKLWSLEHDALTVLRLDQAISLSASTPATKAGATAPHLIPVPPDSAGVAALLVPPESERVIRNGVPLSPGLYLVRHKDRLDYQGRPYWVAADHAVRVVTYQPEVHGEVVYCFITKARLLAREEIVVCPGLPGLECAAIYKKAAWEMALQTNTRFRCPRCGFDPAASDWQPALSRKTSLPQLIELARRHRQRGDM